MGRPITDKERATFDAIREAPNMALVQTAFDGIETAIIACLVPSEDGSGDTEMHPVAVLVTEDMFDRITPPSEDFRPV